MTARIASPVADISEMELSESASGVCIKTGSGGFLVFDDATDARLMASLLLQGADLLDAQKAERDSRTVAIGASA